jgi:putative membrane protein
MCKLPPTGLLICTLVLAGSITAFAAADKSQPTNGGKKLTRASEKFVKEAAEGGLMEVELGKLAVEKANHEQVKAFGRQIQDDHGKANEELKTIAAANGVRFPQSLRGKHKRTADHLAKLSGTEFDRQYMRFMIEDHKKDLEAFQREANNGQDTEVKQFASRQLPVLKQHLDAAQATERQVKESSKPLPSGALPHPNNLKTAAYESDYELPDRFF